MILIWFIGMYVIFIIQQITIFYLVSKGGKNGRKEQITTNRRNSTSR